MKKRTLTENVFYNMLYQVIATVLPIITTPFVTRTIGLHSGGIHSFTESIVTYFIIFGSLGTSLHGIRKIAYVSDDKEQLSKATIEIIMLKLVLMILTLAVYIPTLCINNEFAYIYRIQIINIVANGIDISWFYQGVEDFKKVTIRNLLVKLLFVLALFLFIRKPSDLKLYVFFTVASALIGNLIMIYYLPKYIDISSLKKPNLFSHIKPSVSLFIPQAMNYVYALLDRSMLGWMTNTDNVSIYDQAQRLVRMVTAILQSVGYAMMARVANLTAGNDREGIKEYIGKSVNFNLFLAFPATFGILAVADDFIPFFLGNEYLEVVPTLKILSVLMLTMSMNSVLGVQLLMPMGKEKVYTLATTSGAVVNVLVNLVLIPKMGITAACISSIVAEAVVLAISYWNVRDMLNLGKILKDNAWVILASVVMYFAVRLVAFIDVNIVVKLFLELFVGGGIYFVIMFITRNQILNIIVKKVLGVLKRV